jgi:hypothetical protein
MTFVHVVGIDLVESQDEEPDTTDAERTLRQPAALVAAELAR